MAPSLIESKFGTQKTQTPVSEGIGYRYEMKYVITESRAEAITQFIKPYTTLDHYSRLRTDGAYPITSLYLDSENLQLCRESLCGHKNRFKLRIRSYNNDPDYPKFVEIKRRINTVIIKSRTPLIQRDINTLLSGSPLPTQDSETAQEAVNQFILYMHSINAKPVIAIRYKRQAYENNAVNRVRITIDRNLQHNTEMPFNLSLDGGSWQSCHLNGVILEIKFTGRYTAWLDAMIKQFNLQAKSVSKYVRSLSNASALKFYAPKLTT